MTDIVFSAPALAAILFGYLLGSVPFGLILTQLAGLGDVRKIGSGNIGATNVLRTGNKGLAAATLLLDALKATAAVLLVRAALSPNFALSLNALPAAADASNRTFVIAALAGVAAFIGHVYPVWLGFKGGKGVAPFIGATLGIFWPAAALFCGVWLVLAIGLRYSSLAALGASVMAAAYPFMLGERLVGTLMAIMTVLIFYKHEANIRRLIAGEEPKIGAKA